MNIRQLSVALISLFLFASQDTSAQLAEETLKQRIVKRLPEIVELTVSGFLVEGADGFVQPSPGRSLKGTAQRAVDQENTDRAEVYRIIGKKASPPMSAVEVGRLRAQTRPKSSP